MSSDKVTVLEELMDDEIVTVPATDTSSARADPATINKSPWMIIGVILTLFATVIHINGLATPYWKLVSGVDTHVTEGLWEVCTAGWSFCSTVDDYYSHGDDDYFHSVQAMECLALVAIVLASALVLIGLLLKTGRSLKHIVQASGFLNISATICILIGLTIYGFQFVQPQEYRREKARVRPGYSMILCSVAGAMSLVAGVIFLLKAGSVAESHNYAAIRRETGSSTTKTPAYITLNVSCICQCKKSGEPAEIC